MKTFTTTMIAALAGVAFGGAALAAPPAAEFVKMAGASDLYEQQSSKLVLASTKDAKVKTFANMMIADHMKTTAGVKAAAKQAGMTPKPPMLAPKQADMIAALKAAKGAERDTLYMQQQKMAHDEALALHTDYSQTGDSAPLKQAAATAVPIVQHHIEMLGTGGAM